MMVCQPARWTGFAVASLAVGGVLGWLGTDKPGDANRGGSPGSSASPVASASPLPGQNRLAQAVPVQAPVMAAAPPPATQPSLDVTRQSGVIRIVSTNAPLADAVKALAQATRTNVRGAEALASIATPITLRWQGHDAAAAWNALLGRFASTAVSCSSTACELWIVGVNAPRTAGGSPVGNGSAATNTAALLPAPVVVPQQPAPSANSEENTETN